MGEAVPLEMESGPAPPLPGPALFRSDVSGDGIRRFLKAVGRVDGRTVNSLHVDRTADRMAPLAGEEPVEETP